MLKKTLIFTGFFINSITSYAIPVSFSSQPAFPQTVSPGATTTLTYTVKNNVSVTHPLSFTAQVTPGSIEATGGTCGTTLVANSSCTKIFTYTAPNTTSASTGAIIVNYNGQYKLIDSNLQFVNAGAGGTASIIVTPNPGGVAYNGVGGTHAGTEQFNATEINANGTVNTGATFTWTSSDPTKATIDPSSGLATGASTGTVTITAQDASNTSLTGTATLVIKQIGASETVGSDTGYVYCMGTGGDLTNCAYLPSGKVGAMIATSDAGTSIKWDTSSPFVVTTALNLANGAENTATLQSDTRYKAASLCTDNWHLPAINELAAVAKNAIAINNIHSSNLSNGPYYWSSTQYTEALNVPIAGVTADYAWAANFSYGLLGGFNKGSDFYVRCVQAF